MLKGLTISVEVFFSC